MFVVAPRRLIVLCRFGKSSSPTPSSRRRPSLLPRSVLHPPGRPPPRHPPPPPPPPPIDFALVSTKPRASRSARRALPGGRHRGARRRSHAAQRGADLLLVLLGVRALCEDACATRARARNTSTSTCALCAQARRTHTSIRPPAQHDAKDARRRPPVGHWTSRTA